jgi:hypothetical protein
MGRSSRCQRIIFAAIVVMVDSIEAFSPIANSCRKGGNVVPSQGLSYSRDDNDIDAFDSDTLRRRIQKVQLEVMEEEFRRPPNAEFSPEQLVEEIMNALLDPYDPVPNSGFGLLLRTSTKEWRRAILQSIGARDDVDMELAASCLGAAIGRPHNQFQILVGEGEKYKLDFSSDPLDFEDGTCWVECRLRDKRSSKLLVITGWDLIQREDGAWLVDSVHWQDFRDEFRPGFGREEWMRICH